MLTQCDRQSSVLLHARIFVGGSSPSGLQRSRQLILLSVLITPIYMHTGITGKQTLFISEAPTGLSTF